MSTTLTHVQGLMQSLGPASPWIESLIQEESDSWTLQSDEGLHIAMHFSSESSRIFLTALLGCPEQAHQQAIYATMLSVNLLHAEENSLRVSLTGPNGDLMLISEAPPPETIDGLQYFIWNFHQHASRLMEEIHAITDSDIEPEPINRDFLRA